MRGRIFLATIRVLNEFLDISMSQWHRPSVLIGVNLRYHRCLISRMHELPGPNRNSWLYANMSHYYRQAPVVTIFSVPAMPIGLLIGVYSTQ